MVIIWEVLFLITIPISENSIDYYIHIANIVLANSVHIFK